MCRIAHRVGPRKLKIPIVEHYHCDENFLLMNLQGGRSKFVRTQAIQAFKK